MNKAYLLTGGNIGNREETLEKANMLIRQYCGHIAASSSLYETAAWGNTNQASFLNQALEIGTDLHPRQLLRQLLKIETRIGRIREEKYGPRLIDIDILFYNQEIHNYPTLKVPHPEIQNRRFVLVPLNDIAPGFIHPVLKKTMAELLEACPDPLDVSKVKI
jgi:2-amino-4-hydroxy-6-hydroxymethyldihydropteridine diphosphokinase